ncbi:hypothetical protein HNY73_010721 [Argiope bruennichi]|uniref:Uncharacterized protein n=1 Tax=Argiope bruennichi TaxID=94029 RepID=A0A8T0F1Y9_ARGBR|nr:hypothetical protein HNY73_010721 [Argiope bruennichi]
MLIYYHLDLNDWSGLYTIRTTKSGRTGDYNTIKIWDKIWGYGAPVRRSRAISFLVGCELDSGCALNCCSLLSDLLQRPVSWW